MHWNQLLGSNHEKLGSISGLLSGDKFEFNLHADHGLRELIKNCILDSTVPTAVN